jgi:Asp-tRNA(Asn)/Glu-tRNA(Gln) amidotransferase A subunit family amidase
VSREGQKVYSLILDTLGIYGRSVEDLDVLAEVLGIRDDPIPGERGFKGVSGAKFGVVKGPVWKQAGEGTIAAMEKAKSLLEKYGAVVEDVELPAEFEKMPDWHAKIMAGDGRVAFLSEYRVDKTQIHESLVGHVEGVKGFSRAEELAAFDGVAMLRPRIDEIAGRYAALLTPSVPDEAPLGTESTGSAAFNGMWTVCIHHDPGVEVQG